MQIQIVINMKKILIILLLTFIYGSAQNKSSLINKEGYSLYLVYDECSTLFKKPVNKTKQDYELIIYTLGLPNYKNPKIKIDFIDKDSLSLDIHLKGSSNDYEFSFNYYSHENEKFSINKKKSLKYKFTLTDLLFSNTELLHKIMEKAYKIYILEDSSEKMNEYIAREVDFSIPLRL